MVYHVPHSRTCRNFARCLNLRVYSILYACVHDDSKAEQFEEETFHNKKQAAAAATNGGTAPHVPASNAVSAAPDAMTSDSAVITMMPAVQMLPGMIR